MSAEPFELVPIKVARRPRLPGVVVLRESPDQMIDALLAELFIHARSCVRAFGDFHLAISAVPAVEPALRRLMYDLNYREFPWTRTRLWLVDDVAVPEEDPRSRRVLLRELIVELSGLPPEQYHAMEATDPRAAEAYEARLREHLGWREKGHDRLDFVLLGLHPSGEIAGHAAGPPRATDALVERIPAEGDMPERVAMSMTLINASRFVAIVAAGPAMREPLLALEGAATRSRELPVTRIAPLAGELRWFVDAAACDPEPA
jgi:6-phosphogluconolactonase/glucosamine-6-phosphate isomerase/deaminase